MTPLAERLTLATSRAWTSGGRFLWMIPMPPWAASAMASADSVTVSIGAETRGMLRRMLRVRRVEVSASAGMTPERRGMSSTSSNVMPSMMILEVAVGGDWAAADGELGVGPDGAWLVPAGPSGPTALPPVGWGVVDRWVVRVSMG